MTLTPDDVVNYPLKRAVRGYAIEEVDDLLDKIADTLERDKTEIAELRRRAEQAEEAASSASETDAMLKRTLVTAQRAAEQALEEAKARAKAIVEDAHREANATLEESRAQAEKLRSDAVEGARGTQARVEGLRRFEQEYRNRLARHLEEQLRVVNGLDAEPPGGPPPSPPQRAQAGDSEPESQPGGQGSIRSGDDPAASHQEMEGGEGDEHRLRVRVRDEGEGQQHSEHPGQDMDGHHG